MAGRATKLTPTVQAAIVDAIRTGNTQKIAVTSAGVHQATYYRWLEAGALPGARKLYREFREAVEAAEADAVKSAVQSIRLAAVRGSWTANAWWLERRYPEDWGRKDRVKLEMDDASLALVADAINRTVKDPETLQALMAELARLAETEKN